MKNPFLVIKNKSSPKKSKSTNKIGNVAKPKYEYDEAYRFITYQGSGIRYTIWNSRDGVVPLIIYSRDGKHQLMKSKVLGEREVNHTLEDGDYYFANTTKERAKYLARQIVIARWNNSRYPLYSQYTSKKEARFILYKNLYGDGRVFTILRYGKDPTTYMTKQFKHFISSNTVTPS